MFIFTHPCLFIMLFQLVNLKMMDFLIFSCLHVSKLCNANSYSFGLKALTNQGKTHIPTGSASQTSKQMQAPRTHTHIAPSTSDPSEFQLSGAGSISSEIPSHPQAAQGPINFLTTQIPSICCLGGSLNSS